MFCIKVLITLIFLLSILIESNLIIVNWVNFSNTKQKDLSLYNKKFLGEDKNK